MGGMFGDAEIGFKNIEREDSIQNSLGSQRSCSEDESLK